MFMLLFVCFIVCLTIFRFSRRNLYKYASKIPATPNYPIIGGAHLILEVEDLRQICHKLHEQYGYTFGLWVFWYFVVVVGNPKHLKIVLNSQHCLDKDKRYNLADDVLGNGLIVTPAKIWKHQRKVLNPAFSKKIVDSFVEVFIRHSEVLVQQLEKEVDRSEAFDANDYISKCSLDFICETAMGVSVDAQIKKSPILDITCRLAEILVLRGMKIWLHTGIAFRCSSLGREFYRICNEMRTFTSNIIKKRYNKLNDINAKELIFNENEKKPFLDHLLTLEEKLTQEDLQVQVETFIVAGSDTVATAVQYCLVALGMHKHIQEKVREELLDVFGTSQRPIEHSDLPKLAYLTRVLKETLRLYPPIPFVARTATQDIDLGDCILPQGSTAAISISGVHRNPEYWDNPSEFNPDRFLPEEVAKRHPYSFIPFSAGPRNCIGITYAMAACKIILASVLRSYKIDTKITPESIRFKTEITSKIQGGANITIKKL